MKTGLIFMLCLALAWAQLFEDPYDRSLMETIVSKNMGFGNLGSKIILFLEGIEGNQTARDLHEYSEYIDWNDKRKEFVMVISELEFLIEHVIISIQHDQLQMEHVQKIMEFFIHFKNEFSHNIEDD